MTPDHPPTAPPIDPVPATRPMLRGAFTALVTPFTADGALDEAAFRRLVRWQILAGIDGLVPCGTTGESPTLSIDERERLIAATVEVAAERPSRDRIRVVAGTGTNDTAATIRATRRAAELGADAALVVAPYYNRPDGRMLEAHFRAIADEGDLPIVVYNVPSRTGTNVDADTFLRLAEHPAGRRGQGGERQPRADRPASAATGHATSRSWPATTPGRCAILAMGGDGVVSVASNEIPGELVALCAAALAGDWETARRTHERWLPLFLGNFRGGPNPVPAKAALALMGLLDSDMVRAPLLPLEPDGLAAMAATLRRLGLVEAAGGRIASDTTDGRGRRSHDRRDRAPAAVTTAARTGRPGHRPRDRPRRPRGRPAPRRRARPTAPDGWRVRPEVKAAILACFVDRHDDRLGGRAADRSAIGPRSRRATTWPADRGGSCRAARPSAAGHISLTVSSSCRRRTSTSVPGSARGRWSIRTSSSGRAPRSAQASISPPASRSAACSSRPAPGRSSSRTTRSSARAAPCSRACSSGAARSSAPA